MTGYQFLKEHEISMNNVDCKSTNLNDVTIHVCPTCYSASIKINNKIQSECQIFFTPHTT